MSGLGETLISATALALTAAVVAFGARAGYRTAVKVMGAEAGAPRNVVKNAHVDPQADADVARNFGSRARISTERNLMAGQAVGQTLSYIGGFDDPWAVLRGATVNGVVGQNFGGHAVGNV
jgi:hypothetical protein